MPEEKSKKTVKKPKEIEEVGAVALKPETKADLGWERKAGVEIDGRHAKMSKPGSGKAFQYPGPDPEPKPKSKAAKVAGALKGASSKFGKRFVSGLKAGSPGRGVKRKMAAIQKERLAKHNR